MFYLKCINVPSYLTTTIKKDHYYLSNAIFKNFDGKGENQYHFGYKDGMRVGFYTSRFELIKEFKSNKLIELINDISFEKN